MPRVSYEAFAWWSNYHMTVTLPDLRSMTPAQRAGGDTPCGIVELARAHISDTADQEPLARMAATATMLRAHLAHVADRINTPLPIPGVNQTAGQTHACGMVGSGWSFAALIGTAQSQLMCDGLSHVGSLADSYRHPDCPIAAERIALAGGGTRLREVVNWTEPRGYTIPTSGSFLGPTLAGGAGTSSHGSRLGFGGAQDMIVGMHIVTGPTSHAWIERADRRILSEAGLDVLSGGDGAMSVVRDTQLFEAALVHLGAMGIVSSVAVELVPSKTYHRYRRDMGIDDAWLQQIDRGEFGDIARRLGEDVSPVFYEVTLNPHDLTGQHALHTLYLPDSGKSGSPGGQPPHAADAIAAYAGHLASGHLALLASAPPPDSAAPIIAQLLHGPDSAFAFYLAQGGFNPNGQLWPPMTWGELHDSDEITGGIPGALYNASFAIERHNVSRVLPAICQAIADLPGAFIFTLRFVSNAAGTLAFTRFSETAVIEIDGLSPFICNKAATCALPDLPPAVSQGFSALAQVLPMGAAGVRKALDDIGVAYSLHWGKLGDLDAAKVTADYGDPAREPDSALGRWTAARMALLDDFGRQIFRNPAVEKYEMV